MYVNCCESQALDVVELIIEKCVQDNIIKESIKIDARRNKRKQI